MFLIPFPPSKFVCLAFWLLFRIIKNIFDSLYDFTSMFTCQVIIGGILFQTMKLWVERYKCWGWQMWTLSISWHTDSFESGICSTFHWCPEYLNDNWFWNYCSNSSVICLSNHWDRHAWTTSNKESRRNRFNYKNLIVAVTSIILSFLIFSSPTNHNDSCYPVLGRKFGPENGRVQ